MLAPLTTLVILIASQTGTTEMIRLPERARPMALEVERDPITDTVSAYAVAYSQKGRLSVGCDPDRFRGLRVNFSNQNWYKENLFIPYQRMLYRFDSAPPRRSRWRVRDDIATLQPAAEAFGFIRMFRSSNQVTIRFEDIESVQSDVPFSLHGGSAIVERMLQICDAGSL